LQGWARLELYLDPQVRAGICAVALADPGKVARNVTHLRADLESGAWDARWGSARRQSAFDAGYRLIVASKAVPSGRLKATGRERNRA
jgi:hypothetical protein